MDIKPIKLRPCWQRWLSFPNSTTMDLGDFSTNMHLATKISTESSVRHPDLCFDDGNIAILTGGFYFLVHEGLLCRHSEVLDKLVKDLDRTQAHLTEGRITLHLEDPPEAMANFLRALYDGMWVSILGGIIR